MLRKVQLSPGADTLLSDVSVLFFIPEGKQFYSAVVNEEEWTV